MFFFINHSSYTHILHNNREEFKKSQACRKNAEDLFIDFTFLFYENSNREKKKSPLQK